MGSVTIGQEAWEFFGAEGGPVIDPVTHPDVVFPRRWRVFGPLPDTVTLLYARPFPIVEPRVSAAIEQLTSVPDELTVGDVTLKGRDAEMTSETHLDFADLLGSYDQTDGHHAYAIAEMTVEREADLLFGAGCNFWMQFWIDGQLVLDTLDTSNRISPIDRTDLSFRHRLAPGKHILAIRAISGSAGWDVHAGLISSRRDAAAAAEHSDRWEFPTDGDDIFPPWEPLQHTLAVRTDLCLEDETIEFDYQQDFYSGYVGIVFGAQDSGHYYFAHVPRWGQLHRARAVYAAIGKTDGSGYIRNLRMQLMPNVPVIWDLWGSLKVERRGEMIRMWVNGVEGPCVVDKTYGPGRAGIAGVNKFRIRNLKIDGRRVGPEQWPAADQQRCPWYLSIPEANRGQWHNPASLLKLSDDELLMVASVGRNTLDAGHDFACK